MVWQPGGCSHLETYDPKPDAGSEYRGPFSTIPTKVPGMHFCELLPRQAAIADKFTVLRSMRQTAGGHPAGSMQLLSGDPDTRDKPKPRLPDWMSVTNYVRSQRVDATIRCLPTSASIHRWNTTGRPTWAMPIRRLSSRAIPTCRRSRCPISVLPMRMKSAGLSRRSTLRQNLDTLERAFDQQRELAALDEFETQAMTLLTNPKTKEAFDLSREDSRSP